MAHFIPKKILTEGMAANPLDKQVDEEQDVTKLAQEGILTAIAAETDAINQYTQISDLIFSSEQWLKNLAEPVINDIIAEEKKHLGQLTELLSQLPGYQKDFEEGEKETQTGKDTSKEDLEQKKGTEESLHEDKVSIDDFLYVIDRVECSMTHKEALEHLENIYNFIKNTNKNHFLLGIIERFYNQEYNYSRVAPDEEASTLTKGIISKYGNPEVMNILGDYQKSDSSFKDKEETEESITIKAKDEPIEVETIYVNDAVDPNTGIECIAAYEDSQACLNQEEPTVYLDIDQFKKLQELVDNGSLKIITRDELLANNSAEEIK